jgi:hypothetical protein
MQTDQTLCAQYVPLTSVPRILSQPRFSGAGDVFTLSWNGCGKLKLQTTASLTPPIDWQDVPGSVNRNSIECRGAIKSRQSCAIKRRIMPWPSCPAGPP